MGKVFRASVVASFSRHLEVSFAKMLRLFIWARIRGKSSTFSNDLFCFESALEG